MADYNLVQLVFDRERLRFGEDDAVITCHIRKTTDSWPDMFDMDGAARDKFDQDISAWWSVAAPYVTQHVTFKEARYYDVPTGGPFPPKDPRGHMGDPVRVTPFNSPGTNSSGALPPQVAISVTFKTEKRLEWGRCYFPCPARNTLDDKGAINGDASIALLEAFKHLTSVSGSGAALTVFSRKYWTHFDPNRIQVDDIFDVIRRRRYSAPLFRNTSPPS